MRKVTYDEKTHQFKVVDPRIIDPLNWKESYIDFLAAELQSTDCVAISTNAFTKIDPIASKFFYYDVSRIHAYVLYKLKHYSTYRRDVLGTYDQNKLNKFKIWVDNIYGATLAKLQQLRINDKPDGWEELRHKKFKGKVVRPIETYGSHRVQYVPEFPYSINIYALLFHYEDNPINQFDQAIFDEVMRIEELGEVSQRDKNLYLIKFTSDLAKFKSKI